MSPAQAFLIVCIALLLLVAVPVAVFYWQRWRERRAEARRIEEHTEEFWRQVG